jgi:hypothetical protein
VGVGIVWALLFPIGIPLAFLVMLYRAKVPHLAGWKRDCAWLRAIVQRAILMGVAVPGVRDSDNLTTESVSVEALQLLNKLFVAAPVPEPPPPAARPQNAPGGARRGLVNSTGSTLSVSADGLTVRQLLNAVHASAGPSEEPASSAPAQQQHDADAGDGPLMSEGEAERHERRPRPLSMLHHASGALEVSQQSSHALANLNSVATRIARATTRSSIITRRASTLGSVRHSAQLLPSNAWAAAAKRAWWRVAEALHLRARTLRRVLSIIIYGSEHDLLLGGLLEWARHDKQSLVSEPRTNLMRWRTQYEWAALRAGNVPLSEHDTCERAGFFKFQFLFASYAVHAWYWEAVDMGQKLFLTSIIAFVAPHTAVQVIVACLFAFVLVLFTIQVKPYRERSNNQLVALSQINIFLCVHTHTGPSVCNVCTCAAAVAAADAVCFVCLCCFACVLLQLCRFLFTGLLLQTSPDGVTNDRMLFSVVVGVLTTSSARHTSHMLCHTPCP